MEKNINKMIELLNKSYSPFHVVKNVKDELLKNGFIQLYENEAFNLKYGKSYFVTRNDSSIIAFKIPDTIEDFHFQIIASHTDSPTFKLKQNPIFKVNNTYSLNVEPYGGMIMSTWLDRSLSIAGRITISENENVYSKLINVDKDLLVIPNVAIHMNRDVNNSYKFNPAIDLLPLASSTEKELTLSMLLNENKTIISHDLFLYPTENAKIVGYEDEFLLASKIDNLTSVYSSLFAMLNSNNNAINVLAAFDNEEVGSLTRQGANSTFLKDILNRISVDLNVKNSIYMAISKSSLLSVDNAHAVNPNHIEYSDKTKVLLNNGIVIKYNANQSYTTDAISSSIIKKLSSKENINIQEFSNRSDLRGGSTLGNISNSEISLVSADIGIAQLAMHSSTELCGIKDINAMIKLLTLYYNSNIIIDNCNIIFK